MVRLSDSVKKMIIRMNENNSDQQGYTLAREELLQSSLVSPSLPSVKNPRSLLVTNFFMPSAAMKGLYTCLSFEGPRSRCGQQD